jgi:hypothetical protein
MLLHFTERARLYWIVKEPNIAIEPSGQSPDDKQIDE